MIRQHRAFLRGGVLAAFCLLAPTVSFADVGLPMLAIVWPLSWVAFVPIVAIEAIVARRVVQLQWGKAATSSFVANLVSTIAGIPITWVLLVAIEIAMTCGGRAYGLATPFTKVLAVTLQAPWLIPYRGDMYWMIPAATAFLLPFSGLHRFT